MTTLFFDNILFAQVDSISVSATNAYIKHIDSLANNVDRQKYITRAIAEGTITQETATTSIVGHDNRIDTTRKTITGGWGKYTIENIQGDTAYRIHYHDNLQKNFYLTFYYKDNMLVYSKLEYQENGIGQTFYKKEEYYKNGEIVFTYETKDKIDDTYKRRADINLYKQGNDYFQAFLKDK